MWNENYTIKTGVDGLVDLIRQKKRISVDEASKLLSVPKALVEELADFLEEKEIIGIEYKFAVPYLVYKEMGDEEAAARAKEFAGRKESFTRKIDTTIQNLDQQADVLNDIKQQFAKLSKELGYKMINVKGELSMLARYDAMKKNIDSQILQQQLQFMESQKNLEAQILLKKRSIANMLKNITSRQQTLSKQKNMAKLLKAGEKRLEKRLMEAVKKALSMEDRVRANEGAVDNVLERLADFRKLSVTAKNEIRQQRKVLAPLLEESKRHEQKIIELRRLFMQKLGSEFKLKRGLSSSEIKEIQAKFDSLFSKKQAFENIVCMLDKELHDIRNEFTALLQEATVMALNSKSKKVKDVVKEFEEKFRLLDKKKENFKKDVHKLTSQFGKR